MIYQIRKYVSVLFLFLISLLIVPKEYIHDLAGHEDTLCFFHNGKIVEKPHHHCAILNFNAPLYISASSSQQPAKAVKFENIFLADYSFILSDLSNLSDLRAPPSNQII